MITVEFNEAEALFVRDLLGKLTPPWIEVLGLDDPPAAGTHGVSASLAAFLKMHRALETTPVESTLRTAEREETR